MITMALYLVATLFMNIAWYAHLKFEDTFIFWAIFGSWGIAFIEYTIRIPANRIGHGQFTIAQLQIAYLIINLITFLIFLKIYFDKEPTRNEWLSFIFLIVASIFGYMG